MKSGHPAPALGFLRGAIYPFRGILFLARQPRAWIYAAAPAALYLIMLLVLTTAALFLVDDVYRWMQPDSLAHPAVGAGWMKTLWTTLLQGLLGVAAFLIAAAGAILGTLLLATALAGPFNEKLSEVVELIATGRQLPEESFRLSTLTRDSIRAMTTALQLLCIFGVVYVPLLLISVLPLVGLIGALGLFLYSCFFLALNFLDPILDRRRYSLREKLRWVRSVIGVHMGFGTALFVLMLVPVLNLFLAPGFVAAGTLLWLDLNPQSERENRLGLNLGGGS